MNTIQSCILTNCQHGFRARSSCETQLPTLAQELIECLDNKLQHDLIILGFSKAIGYIPHKRLMVKLGHYGIRGANQRWIQDFLSDSTQQVLVEQAFTFMVGSGHCPMISKYSPTLPKAVSPVDLSFLVVKISHFNKKYSTYSESINSTKQKVHVGCQYSKTCLKQSLKKGKTQILIKKNGS